ncbi:hypothetical protein BDF21DRAFT_411395 [Thamnidium elegans]|nr:hypothetical protein BDF21DRAFT_411395 [Thamnidium elegans]
MYKFFLLLFINICNLFVMKGIDYIYVVQSTWMDFLTDGCVPVPFSNFGVIYYFCKCILFYAARAPSVTLNFFF